MRNSLRIWARTLWKNSRNRQPANTSGQLLDADDFEENSCITIQVELESFTMKGTWSVFSARVVDDTTMSETATACLEVQPLPAKVNNKEIQHQNRHISVSQARGHAILWTIQTTPTTKESLGSHQGRWLQQLQAESRPQLIIELIDMKTVIWAAGWGGGTWMFLHAVLCWVLRWLQTTAQSKVEV